MCSECASSEAAIKSQEMGVGEGRWQAQQTQLISCRSSFPVPPFLLVLIRKEGEVQTAEPTRKLALPDGRETPGVGTRSRQPRPGHPTSPPLLALLICSDFQFPLREEATEQTENIGGILSPVPVLYKPGEST